MSAWAEVGDYLQGPRSDSDGLHVAADFYARGHTDTRTATPLQDVSVSLVMEGTIDEVRAKMYAVVAALMERPDVNDLVYTVTNR